MRSKLALAVGIGFALACGGGGGDGAPAAPAAPAAPKYGSVAFQKYKYDTSTIQFNNDTKVSMWWNNMSCDTREGTWTQEGDELHLVFSDPGDCMGYDDLKMRQMSDCSMVTYWKKNTQTDKVNDDDPWMWERKEPKCR